MDDLVLLADLIKAKNSVDNIIANLIGRPAQIGHVGEYIAAKIFDIELNRSASQKDIDGYFRSGPLAARSVNVKWYGKREGILDLKEASSMLRFIPARTTGSWNCLRSRKSNLRFSGWEHSRNYASFCYA
jgi:hypothetical protein